MRRQKSVMRSDGKGNFTGSTKTRAGKKIPLVGTFTVKNDTLCLRAESTLMGRAYCSEIYRNPDGTAEQSNEFIRIGIWGKSTFSIAFVDKE